MEKHPCSCIGKHNIVKLSILPNVIYSGRSQRDPQSLSAVVAIKKSEKENEWEVMLLENNF